MALKLFDPLKAEVVRKEAQEAFGAPEAPAPKSRKKTARKPGERPQAAVPKAPTPAPQPIAGEAAASLEARLKADFRLFLIIIWRHLLGKDPAPIMLDMAYWLQHGPDRSITMAFRGFSKSWITGAYALWRLYVDPQQKILVVSGSLTRAVATTNWCLALIMEVPILAHLKPLPHQRQSSKSFDVGPATPDQSPSFNAMGIGGQIVGFRGDCIIPDDVETQTNSLTVTMREKTREAVKEFDSVLKPDLFDANGVRRTDCLQPGIKYLGTPHDEDSVYNHLPKAGYAVRIWPGRFPTSEQIAKYGEKLAPYILKELARLGPSAVGTSTMPSRFSDADLIKREMSLGRSEFALQFMLDTSLADRDKYPLKVKDLMVLALDPRKGPEAVSWSNDPRNRITDLQVLGFEGDNYYTPIIPEGTTYAPWSRVIGAVDPAGRGTDECALTILAELHGTLFWLHLWAARDGYAPETLLYIAKACVRFRVHKLRVESNFGDGMFVALLRPVLEREWELHNRGVEKRNRENRGSREETGGTEIEEVRSSNQMAKERRILSVMEPVTQQHRLVVDRSVLEYDWSSIKAIDGEDGRHRYAWGYQYTHLTRDRESLYKDDRLEALSMAVADYADILGVDPALMAVKAVQGRQQDELEKLLGWDDEHGLPVDGRGSGRAASFGPQQR